MTAVCQCGHTYHDHADHPAPNHAGACDRCDCVIYSPRTETQMSMIRDLQNLVEGYDDPIERGDDFNPGDHYGNNADDIYTAGVSQGYAELAAEVRRILQIQSNT